MIWEILEFQSLSRDSGRLNDPSTYGPQTAQEVSIPQSGFGAFERGRPVRCGCGRGRFNPSVGIRGV